MHNSTHIHTRMHTQMHGNYTVQRNCKKSAGTVEDTESGTVSRPDQCMLASKHYSKHIIIRHLPFLILYII